MNIKQQEEKMRKLIEFRDLFRTLKNSVSSIRELSLKLGSGYSKSTIQRYIHELYEKKMINEEEYQEAQVWLKENKEKGTIQGGLISQEQYGYCKDEYGHFQGRKK